MRENSKNTSHNFEDDDDITPDMSYPHWVSRFEKATLTHGRPKLETPKVSTTIRFDADILARPQTGGAGWQSRINDALRQWLSEHVSDT